jgi:hypothetical protein
MTGRTSVGREEYWRDVIRQQRSSDLSISAFCRERDLAEGSYFYWRRKLTKGQRQKGSVRKENESRQSGVLQNTVATFVPVAIPAPNGTTRANCEVVLPDGCRIIIPTECDAGWLREILGVLGERSC